MIPAVLQGLREHGLLHSGRDPEFHVTLTQGDAIHVRVYEADRLRYFLKCSKYNSLVDEYERQLQAREVLGEAVAPPRALLKSGDWSVIASEGIAALPVRRTALLDQTADPGIVKALEAFFTRQARVADRTHTKVRAERLMQNLNLALDQPAFFGLKDRVFSPESWRLVHSLPNMPQHGDFVQSNLAWANDTLVVFDYEDFGRIQLPGFDLATLYLSLFSFVPDSVLGFMRASEAEIDSRVAWLRPCCAALGLSFDTMRNLMPIYLAAFVSLKRNYGPAVRHVAERALAAFSSVPDV